MMQALVTDSNQVVAILGPDKEGLKMPTEDAIKKILKDIKAEKLTAYVDKVSDEPLMGEAPKGGKIVSEQTDDTFGTTTLTLSNGVKVIIKKTDFKADEIRMKAGKTASVSYGIGDKTETVNGSCSPKDFETMMQLTYLTFTAPRRDDDAFASYKNRNKAALQNMEMNPQVAFSDSVSAGIYMHEP